MTDFVETEMAVEMGPINFHCEDAFFKPSIWLLLNKRERGGGHKEAKREPLKSMYAELLNSFFSRFDLRL